MAGGPIHKPPKNLFGSNSIVDIDDTFVKAKQTFKAKLASAWNDALRLTQPYKFDPKINKRGSRTNPPVSPSALLRFGQKIVRDEVV